MSYFIYGNKIFNCGEVGISVSGVNDVYIGNNKIFDTPIGIKLTDCQTANVKSNEGTRVKTLVHINETSKSVVKEKNSNNIRYEIMFNKKIKELLSLEAQLKNSKSYKELTMVRLLKANLKLKI